MTNTLHRVIVMLLLSLMLAGCGILFPETVIVEPDEWAVVAQPEQADMLVLEPGTHIVDPNIGVFHYPSGIQIYTMSGPSDDPAAVDSGVESLSLDGQRIRIDLEIEYRLVRDDLITLHTRWQNRYEPGYVRSAVRAGVREVVSGRTAEEIYTDTLPLTAALDLMLAPRFAEEGLELVAVTVTDTHFSPLFEEAMAARQEAMRQMTQAAIELENLEAEAAATRAAIEDAAATQAAAQDTTPTPTPGS